MRGGGWKMTETSLRQDASLSFFFFFFYHFPRLLLRCSRCNDEVVSAPSKALKRTRARTRTRRYTVPPVNVRVLRVYGSMCVCVCVVQCPWVSPVFVRERFIAPSCPRQSVPRTTRETTLASAAARLKRGVTCAGSYIARSLVGRERGRRGGVRRRGASDVAGRDDPTSREEENSDGVVRSSKDAGAPTTRRVGYEALNALRALESPPPRRVLRRALLSAYICILPSFLFFR